MSDHQLRTLRFLVDATTTLASSLDVEATLKKVAQLAVPAIADWCIVELARGTADGEQVVIMHADPQQADRLRELRRTYPADRDASHGVQHVLRTGVVALYESVPDEVLIALADDARHLELLRSFGFRSAMVVPMIARGEILGAITFATAESDRRYGEQDLEVAQGVADRAAFALDNAHLYEELQRAVRARDELIAIVSHDLRNPLSTVLSGASMLLEDIEKERVHKIAKMIVRSAGRMETLINDLLDLGRLDAGSLAIVQQAVDVGDVLLETVEAHADLAAQKSQWLGATALDGVVIAHADRQRLLQILSNLVANAIRFTPEHGSVTVSAHREGEMIVILVADSGPGIPQEHLAHVFDRFWRGRPNDKTSLGLGLSIVKGLVDAHGGAVAVASEPGRGATFSFTLPATNAEVTAFMRPVVLLVDDDPSIRRAIERALTAARFRVVTASDGVEALERLRSERAQLIILDLMMPRMDGLEFRVHQSRDPRLATIPTVVMTAFEKLSERMERFGPTSVCIQKPFRIKELVRIVEQVVAERSAPR